MLHARSSGLGWLAAGSIAAVLGAGCGDDAKPGADPARFLGTWVADTGNLTAMCGAFSLPAQDLKDQMLIFSSGTDAPLIIQRGDCRIAFDINGDVATARPNQTCAATVPNPLPGGAGGMLGVTLNIDKATFTLNGTLGVFQQSGTVGFMGGMAPAGQPTGCTYSILANTKKTS